jgi:hypothetical protein|eukprot:jgi/Chrpa1/17639/Chrysochromulina_OHIO_Genome00023857-RA
MIGSPPPPPQLTVGKPINLYADVPIFPPFAVALTIMTGLLLAKLTGKRLAFLPAPLSKLPVRIAFMACALAFAKMEFDEASGALETAGSGTFFTPVNGLATTGLYKFTRNPMYVAVIFFAIPSVSCLINSAWPLLVSPLTWCYLNFIVIAAEEKLLSQTFPKQYEKYCESAPRWLI